MSRDLYLRMDEDAVIASCLKENVGLSAIERLPQGGIRLVCMSGDGAEAMRTKLKRKLITGQVTRQKIRLDRLHW